MKISTTVFFLLLFVCPVFSNTIYVRQGVDGDGSSWNAAIGQLTFALQNAQFGDTILISAGIYYPTTGNDRSATFLLPDGVHIQGGFSPTGTPAFAENSPFDFPTILSGNIGNKEDFTDNSYHVVSIFELSGTTTLNGLIIQDGYAFDNGASATHGGGVLFQSSVSTEADGLRIIDCIFQNNQAINGGALYTLADSITTQITIQNCQFKQNISKFGAAIHSESNNLGDLEISAQNCRFEKNKATDAGGAIANYANGGNVLFAIDASAFIENEGVLGGAMYNFPSGANLTVDVENCIFSQNLGESGGGIENFAFDGDFLQLNLRSCTFNGNRANVGAAVSIFGAGVNLQATNTIFWGNAASDEGNSLSSQFDAIASLQNCLIEENNCGGISFRNTICRDVMFNQDPLFFDTLQHNLSVLPCSPIIDNGVLTIGGTDFAGNPRIVGDRNDIGAYEVQTTAADTILYVNNQNVNLLQDGVSWGTAFSSLNAALKLAKTCGLATEIWIAAGTYYPTADTTRYISFNIENDLKIYGGFDGTESKLEERDLLNNETVLSGNIGNISDSTDNSNTILKITADAILEHLTIRDGYAMEKGGGVLIDGSDTASIQINHCKIINNTAIGNGGAIALVNNGQLIMANSSITDNTATNFGGGLYRTLGTVAAVRNCFFLRNSAATGGAIYQTGNAFSIAEMAFVNCILAQNTATNNGGAIYNAAANSTLINCTVVDNEAQNGAAIYTVSASDLTQTNINTIFANNLSSSELVFGLQARGRFDHCLLSGYEDCPEGASCEESIFDVSPSFIEFETQRLYQISTCSPAMNKANQEIAPDVDIYGNPRVPDDILFNNVADIGAVEQYSTADYGGFSSVIKHVGCSGEATGQIVVEGNDDFIFPYAIVLNGDTLVNPEILAIQTYLIDSLTAGIYTVRAIDVNGCFFENDVEITQESSAAQISLEISNEIVCANECKGAVSLANSDSNGTYTYLWNDGSTEPNRDNLCAGKYIVTVTNDNGCTVTDSIEIVEPEMIDIQFSVINATDNLSADGSILITATGGTMPYEFNWDNGIGIVQNPSDLAAGTYTLTVTDANGCTAVVSIEIFATGDALIFQNIEINNLLCNADNTGAIQVNVSGGEGAYTFNWSPTAADTNALDNLPAGDYSLTITDEVGTQIDTIISILEPDIFSAAAIDIANVSCFAACDGQADIVVTGGTAPYAYSWIDGNSTARNLNLCAGIPYTVTITDANNCETIIDSIIVTQPDSLQIKILTFEDSGNNDGVAVASVLGGTEGYSYTWKDEFGSLIGFESSITDLAAGEYCAIVLDANECVAMLCDTVRLATNTIEINNNLTWEMYPVPAQNEVQIELDFLLQNDWNLQLLDVNGRLLQQQNLKEKNTVLSIENLPTGIFYVRISDGNQLAIKRLIKT